MVFVIGGDGTQFAGHRLYEAARQRHLAVGLHQIRRLGMAADGPASVCVAPEQSHGPLPDLEHLPFLQASPGTDQGLHISRARLQHEHLDSTAGGATPMESGVHDARVVDDQDVPGSQQPWEIGHQAVFKRGDT